MSCSSPSLKAVPGHPGLRQRSLLKAPQERRTTLNMLGCRQSRKSLLWGQRPGPRIWNEEPRFGECAMSGQCSPESSPILSASPSTHDSFSSAILITVVSSTLSCFPGASYHQLASFLMSVPMAPTANASKMTHGPCPSLGVDMQTGNAGALHLLTAHAIFCDCGCAFRG